jgi:exoribonuclease R
MLALSKHNWLAGTLELTSKVRYGLSSRGVPLFRFVPYDKRFPPLAVGCSQRNLFYNVHAIIEPSPEDPKTSLELRKGTLIQNLGKPSLESEGQILLAAHAHDNRKELRKFPAFELPCPQQEERVTPRGTTFHIDPPGCRDVDDSITLFYNGSFWEVAINIADVAAAVPLDSPLDIHARNLATSFYTPEGRAVQSMLPPTLSEGALSLLPGSPKNTVSLLFDFYPHQPTNRLQNVRWALTQTTTTLSYTYDEADNDFSTEMLAFRLIAETLGAPPKATSHEWVQAFMIYYNKEAGALLSSTPNAILRRHSEKATERLSAALAIPGIPEYLNFEAAEYCLSSDSNTFHFGLSAAKYAYASSPLRRYADLVNQRAIKAILSQEEPTPLTQTLVEELNRREKQAKAFSRDYFFMTALANPEPDVKGIVMEATDKLRIWVPSWKRVITVKSASDLKAGTHVTIQWYDNKEQARWKERIVFKLSAN